MLQVYLLLNGLPQESPGFAGMLQTLHQTTRLNLTVINNGQPFSPKRVFHQLGLTCRLLEYPLRFHPAQILADQLRLRTKAEHFLWLEDTLLWHPAHLPLWLRELDNWTWIAPRLLPAQSLPQTRQIYQVQALSRPTAEPRLQATVPECFPPCFCFGRSGMATLQEWLRPEGQLPLLLMAATDMSTPAWHPAPAPDPGQTEFALRIDEALARWQAILTGAEPARMQTLLESLQRALPDSPAVYGRLAPLLDPAEAVAILEIALRRHLIYPELLALMAQGLIACHQPELAAVYLRYLQQRFAAFQIPVSPWPDRKGVGLRLHPEALPHQARLSVCVIVQNEASRLPACLDSLKALDAEVIVVDTGSQDQSAQLAAARGALVCPLAWQGDFAAARNFALEQASGDWVLMLDADELLEPRGLPLIRRLLVDPPPGLPCFLLPVLEHRAGRFCRVRYAPRLFPRHPLLRYEGAVLEQLTCQGPGDPAFVPLPGVSLLHYPEPWRFDRKLALLQAQVPGSPREWIGLAECLADAGQTEAALQAYGQALDTEATIPGNEAWLAVAVVGTLEALICLNRFEEALMLARTHEKLCQMLPDYWYLRGQLANQVQGLPDNPDENEAMIAFERCLSFRGQPLTLPVFGLGTRVPERMDRLPLLALAACYRAWMHHPGQELRRRQQWAQQLLSTLQQLLQADERPAYLFLWLAEAALVAARMQRGSTLALYNEHLPAGAESELGAYYAETALLYLEGRPESLMDRLPADYSYETIRDLQLRPYTLLGFCQELWQRTELDGPQQVTALLTIAAQAHQDLSLWLMLSHLYSTSGQMQAALAVLGDALLQLPGNPYLLCHLARLHFDAGEQDLAQQRVQQALALRPDLEDALHLQQQLTASKRRKRYTEGISLPGNSA